MSQHRLTISPDSLIYLPISEAVVITFLAPMLASWVGSFINKIPFTRGQQIGVLVSFLGVVLISKPFSLINSLEAPSHFNDYKIRSTLSRIMTLSSSAPGDSNPTKAVTPAEHALAVAVGLLGVCGASTAYITIARKQDHRHQKPAARVEARSLY